MGHHDDHHLFLIHKNHDNHSTGDEGGEEGEKNFSTSFLR